MESQIKISVGLLGLKTVSFCIHRCLVKSVLKMTATIGPSLKKAAEENCSHFGDQTQP